MSIKRNKNHTRYISILSKYIYKNTNLIHFLVKLMNVHFFSFRYADQLSIGYEVFVYRNSQLTQVKVINVSTLSMKGKTLQNKPYLKLVYSLDNNANNSIIDT